MDLSIIVDVGWRVVMDTEHTSKKIMGHQDCGVDEQGTGASPWLGKFNWIKGRRHH